MEAHATEVCNILYLSLLLLNCMRMIKVCITDTVTFCSVCSTFRDDLLAIHREYKSEQVPFQIFLSRLCTRVPSADQKELLTSGQVCSILVLHQTPSSKRGKGGQSIYKTTQNKQTHFRRQRTSLQLQPSCCPDLLQASSVQIVAKSISLVSEAQWCDYQVY